MYETAQSTRLDPEKEPNHVSGSFNRLAEAVSHNSVLVEQIEKRLEVVTRSNDIGGNESKHAEVPKPYKVPLAAELENLVEIVARSNMKLDSMLHRLEL